MHLKTELKKELSELADLGKTLTQKRKELIILDGQLNEKVQEFMQNRLGLKDAMTLPEILYKTLEFKDIELKID